MSVQQNKNIPLEGVRDIATPADKGPSSWSNMKCDEITIKVWEVMHNSNESELRSKITNKTRQKGLPLTRCQNNVGLLSLSENRISCMLPSRRCKTSDELVVMRSSARKRS
jgi:hypothetical protein